MAKNVVINGVTYSDVPSVEIPSATQGDPDAVFYDTSSGDAVAGEIAAGKKAYGASGEITGTAAAGSASTVTLGNDSVSVAAGLYGAAVTKQLGMDGNASASDVLSGKTFYKDSLTKLTGTATVPTVSQDSTSKVLSIS